MCDGVSGRKPVSRESSTCTDASNLCPLSPIQPHSILLYKLKKQKEETEKQLEKTQTIQKMKIFALGTFKKKIRFSVCPADASWCLAEVWIFLHLLVQLVPPLLNPFHLELVDRLQVFCVKHKAVEFPCSFVLSVALFYDRHATLIDRENERNGEAGSVC